MEHAKGWAERAISTSSSGSLYLECHLIAYNFAGNTGHCIGCAQRKMFGWTENSSRPLFALQLRTIKQQYTRKLVISAELFCHTVSGLVMGLWSMDWIFHNHTIWEKHGWSKCHLAILQNAFSEFMILEQKSYSRPFWNCVMTCTFYKVGLCILTDNIGST